MTYIPKIAGTAAVTLGGLFLVLAAVLMYLPSIGLGPGTLNDPETGIRFIESSFIPAGIALIYLGIGVATMVALSATAQALRATQPTLADWTVFAGTAAGALMVGYAMSDLVALPYATAAYHVDAVIGSSAYVAIRAVGHGLSAGALFATGMGVAIVGFAGMRDRVLPRALCVLMILGGLSVGLSFIILPLGLVGLLMAPIWSIWLGVVLLIGPKAQN